MWIWVFSRQGCCGSLDGQPWNTNQETLWRPVGQCVPAEFRMEFQDAAEPGGPHGALSRENWTSNLASLRHFCLAHGTFLLFPFFTAKYIYNLDGWWGYVIEKKKKFYIEGISTPLSPRKAHCFRIAEETPNEMHSIYVEWQIVMVVWYVGDESRLSGSCYVHWLWDPGRVHSQCLCFLIYNIYLMGLLWGFNKLIFVKYLEDCSRLINKLLHLLLLLFWLLPGSPS